MLATTQAGSCGRDDCGRWEAVKVDPRLRTFTVQIAAGIDGALGEIGDFDYSGYELRDSGTTQDLLAVFADRYWGGCPYVVVGRAGTIRISEGAEKPWRAPATETVDADLRGVAYGCYEEEFGVAVGDDGVILTGRSSATQWAIASTPTTRRLHAVAIAPDGQATAVGEKGTVARTFDAGMTWEVVQVPTTEDLLAIQFQVRSNFVVETQTSVYTVQGYMAGASGTLLYSPDGLAWDRVETGVTEDLRQVIFHADEAYGDDKPYILGDTRLFTWSPGQLGLDVAHELRRPILAVAEYFYLRVLAEGGLLMKYKEPYVCELPPD